MDLSYRTEEALRPGKLRNTHIDKIMTYKVSQIKVSLDF